MEMSANAVSSISGGLSPEAQSVIDSLGSLETVKELDLSVQPETSASSAAKNALPQPQQLREPIESAINLISSKSLSAAAQEEILTALIPKITPAEIDVVFEPLLRKLRLGKVKSVGVAQDLISKHLECSGDYSRCALLYASLLSWCEEHKMEFLATRVRLDRMDLELRSRDPELMAQAADEAEQLVNTMKDKDASGQLAKAQIAAIEALHRINHLKAAKGHMMTARAVNIRLTAPVQARLDCASGAVCMDSGEYSGAMGYFQEACNVGYPCFSQLLLTKLATERYSEVDGVLSKRVQLQTPEALAKLEKGGIGAHHSLSELQAVDSEALVPLRGLAHVLQDMTSRTFLQDLDRQVDLVLASGKRADGRDLLPVEIRRYLALLVRARTAEYLRRTLRPYSRLELSRLSETCGVPQSRLQPLLMQMIVDGELDFVIDEASGCLEARNAPASEAWAKLEEGKEVLADLFSLAGQVRS